MRLEVGSRIGRYEIVERIGAGGMGEVYRARDTRLEKTVAIKIIASGFLDDPIAGPRFERERKLTAALEHPHVCRVLDAGHDDGVTYLAMEYLEGEPLSKRLARGSIPPRQALGYAIELAEALSYAHSRGVIHRDLKPANVHLTPTGLKVLDFGLAKLRPTTPPPGAPQPDTAPLLKTTPGTLIGTALYMAPERLEGAEADERTDVFSFGLIVYEMIAGRPAFHGDSMASLIADVMTAEPAPLPACGRGYEELEWIVRTCLAKPPHDRWQSMHDVAAVLKRVAGRPPGVVGKPGRRGAIAVAAAIAAILLSGIAAWSRLSSRESSTGAPIVFRVEPPPGGGFTPTANSVQSPMLAVSPDGTALAFVASAADGASRIWIRSFDSLVARPLRGTDDAIFPFWSPNGRSIGFFSGRMLKRIDVAGGPPRVLAPAPVAIGGAWGASDVILFGPSVKGALQRVSPNGGNVSDETQLDAALGQTSHRWPRFIGDGATYLFFARSTHEASEGIYLASLGSGAPRLVVRSEYAGDVGPPSRLLYVSEGSLVAQPFDPVEARVSGEAVLVAEGIAGSSSFYPAFSVSRTGVLAFASVAQASELTWFDRTGRPISVGARGPFVDFRLSPDNQHLAVAQTDPRTGRPDLYLFDVKRESSERLTSSRVSDATPTWSPDGLELLFRSNREAVHDLYRRAAFSTEPERPFLKSGAAKYPTSWSGSAGAILFHTLGENGWDVWAVPAGASARATPVIQTRFNEAQGQLSSDGRWIAYAADDGSSFDVYIQRFPPEGRRWRISMAGGFDPRWNRNGSELFYVSADGWLMAVATPLTGDMQPAAPRRLFQVPKVVMQPPYTSLYDVSADAKRFLVRVPREDVRTLPLTVVVDWPNSTNGLARRH